MKLSSIYDPVLSYTNFCPSCHVAGINVNQRELCTKPSINLENDMQSCEILTDICMDLFWSTKVYLKSLRYFTKKYSASLLSAVNQMISYYHFG